MRTICFLLLSCVLLPLSLPAADVTPQPAEMSVIHRDLADRINALCLYHVKNGRTSVSIYRGTELQEDAAIFVEGYISGIVLLSSEPIDARVDGRSMRTLQFNPDGTCDLSSYGNLQPDELTAAFRDAGQFDFDLDKLKHFKGRYACFPKVPGDAVSRHTNFSIVLNDCGRSRQVPLLQNGSSRLTAPPACSDTGRRVPRVNYLGNDLQQFKNGDFETRIEAIISGIQNVESAVGEALVTSVNLLDYRGPNNALTCDGRKEIWIYTNTFWRESPEELITIAEHETLHILTDHGKLTKNAGLREMFADLRGLDPLSMERFVLITTGIMPRGNNREKNKTSDHILFAFINEMNFFKDMKGGHSRDSLDEFCASFLHTLLYSQNLGQALQRPVILPGAGTRVLSPADQSALLKNYTQVIEKFISALGNDSSKKSIKIFLQESLRKSRHLGNQTA
jgi:hypothetical protein